MKKLMLLTAIMSVGAFANEAEPSSINYTRIRMPLLSRRARRPQPPVQAPAVTQDDSSNSSTTVTTPLNTTTHSATDTVENSATPESADS